jgi:hypothetical protein
VEYVTCRTCKSPDTDLKKGENRLFFVTCNSCGSRRSVAYVYPSFSAGFHILMLVQRDQDRFPGHCWQAEEAEGLINVEYLFRLYWVTFALLYRHASRIQGCQFAQVFLVLWFSKNGSVFLHRLQLVLFHRSVRLASGLGKWS